MQVSRSELERGISMFRLQQESLHFLHYRRAKTKRNGSKTSKACVVQLASVRPAARINDQTRCWAEDINSPVLQHEICQRNVSALIHPKSTLGCTVRAISGLVLCSGMHSKSMVELPVL